MGSCYQYRRAGGMLLAFVWLVACCPAQEQVPDLPEAPVTPAPAGVMQAPQVMAFNRMADAQVHALFRQGEYEQAERMLRASIQRSPNQPVYHYNLACSLARQKRIDEAFASLQQAVTLGFVHVQPLRMDADLDGLRADDRFAAILESAEIRRAAIESRSGRPFEAIRVMPGGPARVTDTNTVWDNQLSVFRLMFAMEPPTGAPPVMVRGQGTAGEQIRAWHREGTAAGLAGVLYDNQDRGHSVLASEPFPELARVVFDPGLTRARPVNGLQTAFLFNLPVIGNSSTALTQGYFWRSLPRLAMVNPSMVWTLYRQYTGNQLYVYPEHQDHDPGRNGEGGGYGDVYPANLPYVLISQGSSGSDQLLLEAVACTVAAFRPETRRALELSAMLMPAVQMILRSSLREVVRPEDYRTGKAHPTVFAAGQLNVDRMVARAHAMKADRLPPLAQLHVIEESEGAPGQDYFDIGSREKLFDTPCAVARVIRSTAYWRRLVVSAETSRDPQGLPLTYHWAVLRGDPAIVIRPLNAVQSLVELKVPYHPRRPVSPGAALESSRVDIGLFVDNGTHPSPPAFISLYYLASETRVYGPDQRVQSVTYRTPATGGAYTDPFIDIPKDWTDAYAYDTKGRLTGWIRSRGDQRESFTVDGLKVEAADDQGRATHARTVRYVPSGASADSAPVLVQQDGGEVMQYAYGSNEDRVGRVVGRVNME